MVNRLRNGYETVMVDYMLQNSTNYFLTRFGMVIQTAYFGSTKRSNFNKFPVSLRGNHLSF